MHKLADYLAIMAESKASDLFIVAGSPVSQKIGQDIDPAVPGEASITRDDTRRLIGEIFLHAHRDVPSGQYVDQDFSFSEPGLARFRASIYKQRESMAASIRIVPFGVPDHAALNIPEPIMSLSDTPSGLILITGAAGSGKSTTQACLIDRINKTRKANIITLEDPIEFLHRNDRSIIAQREIGIDIPDCLSGIKQAIRQASNIISLDEMHDPDVISTALAAADTGRLVIATMHTQSARTTVERIIDSFPYAQQQPIQIQLAGVLRSVVSQQLVCRHDGPDRLPRPVFEVMNVDQNVRELIKIRKIDQIQNIVVPNPTGGA